MTSVENKQHILWCMCLRSSLLCAWCDKTNCLDNLHICKFVLYFHDTSKILQTHKSGDEISGDLGGQTFRETMRPAEIPYDIPNIVAAVRVAGRSHWKQYSRLSTFRQDMDCLINSWYRSPFTVRLRNGYWSHADVKLYIIQFIFNGCNGYSWRVWGFSAFRY